MTTTNIIIATITAYCACKQCCGPNAKGICANNSRPTAGTTIAASRTIPLGCKVIIKGFNYTGQVGTGDTIFTVQDRLARRYDSRFDIYFTKHSDAKKFGIKTNQTIKIISPL